MDGAQLSAFRAMLDAFHRRAAAPMGDIERFEFLSHEMFDVFLPSGALGARHEDFLLGGLLPSENSLDTGNSYWPAPPDFLAGLTRAAGDPDGLRGYYGPLAQDGLADAVRAFLKAEAAIPADTLDVTVGAGTVHLYDLLCRHLVRRAGDVVLSAHPVYGFFIPHAERADGRTLLLRPDDGFRCTPELLHGSIRAIEDDLLADWRDTAAARTELWLSGLLTRLGVRGGRALVVAGARRIAATRAWPERPRDCDALVRALLSPLLAEAGLDWDHAVAAGRLPNPPRVVAWLHINPTQGGDLYRQPQVDRLAEVLADTGVTPVEDLAYHSIRAPLPEIGSFLRTGTPAYQLLGLSKPLAIADCRLGVLVSPPGTAAALGRLVETSVGWVPAYLQAAVRDVLTSPRTGPTLDWQSHGSPDGYAEKAALAAATLRGFRRAGPPGHRVRAARVAVICADLAAELTARLRAHGRSPGAADATGSLAAASGSARSVAADFDDAGSVARFLDRGLGRWLTVPREPETGFFVMADCGPLLASELGRALRLTCSFDVFALLVHFMGIRTIPEEVMTVRGAAPPARLLRLTFGVAETTWVRACFLIHFGLELLERGLVGAPPTR
ncbi:hypothetical protein ACFWP2_15835 [Kitasatospora sp. NPDC058444]|uniref:hypothetical protein n=1 Tax=Kitasatospora sp. NPDC058444 TaxID=3346504 RepID=UPI00365A6BB0